MFNHLTNLFFPLSCAGCDSILLADEKVICTRCRHEVPLTNHYLFDDNEMKRKFYGRIPILHAASLFYFHKEGIVQEMMHKLKYRGHEEIGDLIGDWFASILKTQTQWTQADVLVPVPLHKRRLNQRGYNQVTTFGKALSNSLGIPFEEHTLKRVVFSNSQTNKGLLSRSELKGNTFEVACNSYLEGKHVILLDDVITTGSTLENCCKALMEIPNVKISILCMAMAHS